MATDTPPLAEPGVAVNAFVEAALPDTTLKHTAQALAADDKDLLAIDESIRTCNRRFAKLGVPQTVQARRAYRELIITTPNLRDSISGVIVCAETIRQHTADGVPFLSVLSRAGIGTGIKFDLGTTPMAGHPGERITEGLDGLRARLAAINTDAGQRLPWPVAFSFGRAIQQPALTTRDGQDANAARAQQALQRRVAANRDARRGTDTLPHGVSTRDEHGVAASAPGQHGIPEDGRQP
ncbi:fructose-bisphosphate aldolase [Paeniglutamicibacter antarcticus]|uniref:fructose-bisphosphate aldolase n=1 Tax=Arthrobacter terrae TaxID=2935737 RepID=A0A931G8C2_9MICC|nr:class I fructose-bisphosphate aldolase [Arthrobacter terrae]MBG0740099.1 fructose-bisphosphate aldolase [Arthrobacter terrae]